MMNLKADRLANGLKFGLCAALLTSACLITPGCSEEEPAPVAVAPPPPPPPPAPVAPAVLSIEQLMAELNIDPRVNLPEDKAPGTTEDRKAVLEFFDAFARGNSGSLKSMLTEADQRQLAALVASPAWKTTTAEIKQIDIQTGTNPTGQKCALAVFETGSGTVTSFQPQLWAYNTEEETPVFESESCPPGIMDKLTGDWIATWYQILADEMALATKPEEEYDLAQQNLDNSEDGGSAKPPPPKGGMRAPSGPPTQAPGVPGGGDGPRGP